jgi:hypothetical protein
LRPRVTDRTARPEGASAQARAMSGGTELPSLRAHKLLIVRLDQRVRTIGPPSRGRFRSCSSHSCICCCAVRSGW